MAYALQVVAVAFFDMFAVDAVDLKSIVAAPTVQQPLVEFATVKKKTLIKIGTKFVCFFFFY